MYQLKRLPRQSTINEESIEHEKQMYGTTYEEAFSSMNDFIKFQSTWSESAEQARNMCVISMLSDCQEMILRNQNEEARQTMNVVKMMLISEMEEVES